MLKNRLFENILGKNTLNEHEIINEIRRITSISNLDNISRTREYQTFYLIYPEIKWSFLASMVSRNAGWNMCDLKGQLYPHLLDAPIRKRLYLTYERANWLIFQDAFPQLLLYHYSTIYKRSLFHLLGKFHVSKFMEREWEVFYKEKDRNRLMISLIINEQNIIQNPIILHPVYKKRIFSSFFFKFQELFHFSCVVFPTLDGGLYGSSVKRFRRLSSRIELGKRLASILFNEEHYSKFLEFAIKVEHTGSRRDYEQFIQDYSRMYTPVLRSVYPIIDHHIHQYEDWSTKKRIHSGWYTQCAIKHPEPLNNWFLSKQGQIKKLTALKERLS